MKPEGVAATVQPHGRWLWYIAVSDHVPGASPWVRIECGHAFRLGRKRADRKAGRMIRRRVARNARVIAGTHEVTA